MRMGRGLRGWLGVAAGAWCGLVAAAAFGASVAVVDLPREGMTLYPDGPAGIAPGDPLPTFWFPVGEEALYEVNWGFFTVGEGSAKVDWFQDEEGRTLLEIVIRAKSNGIVEMLYPVEEFLRTVVDPYTFLPLSYEKINHEGRHDHDEITTFDHAAGMAHYRSRIKDKQKDYEIKPDMRDLLATMYWVRHDPLRQAGDTRHFDLMTDDKVYEMLLTAEKEDTVKVGRYGKVKCLKVEPEGKFEGMFLRKGRMWTWLTLDERYTMAKIEASVPVADVSIELIEVRGPPGDDFWTTPPEKKQKSKPQRHSAH